MRLSQQKMADLLKISRTAYRKLEVGNTAIFGKALSRFMQATGVSFEELAYGDSEKGLENLLREEKNFEQARKAIIAEYENRLAEMERLLLHKESIIEEKNKTIADRDKTIADKESMIARLYKELGE